MSGVAKIVIIEKYRIYADALTCLFAEQNDVQLVKVLDNREELYDLLSSTKIDIVLTDLDFRDIAGLELSRDFLKEFPDIKIVAFTAIVKPFLIEFAIYNGIKGFVDKHDSLEKLIEVVQIVHHCGSVYPEPFAHLSGIVDYSPLDCLSGKKK